MRPHSRIVLRLPPARRRQREVAHQQPADREPAPRLRIEPQPMGGFRVLQRPQAVARRSRVSRLGQRPTSRLLDRYQQRQVRLATAARCILAILCSTNGAAHRLIPGATSKGNKNRLYSAAKFDTGRARLTKGATHQVSEPR